MNTVKNFLKSKSVGFYICVSALIFAIITLIIYVIRGGNSYSPVSSLAITMLSIGITTNILVLSLLPEHLQHDKNLACHNVRLGRCLQ